jgi:hypothetical protein
MAATMAGLTEPVQRVLDRYGFTLDDRDVPRWRFDGHPSRRTTLLLSIDATAEPPAYVLFVEDFSVGGGGLEEDSYTFSLSEEAALIAELEWRCEEALEPYVKTRLQRWFEPLLGQDGAYVFFGRKRRR